MIKSKRELPQILGEQQYLASSRQFLSSTTYQVQPRAFDATHAVRPFFRPAPSFSIATLRCANRI
jgi:hypothetical protein